MTEPARIVGIALLRNEEYFAAWSLSNVAAFCDELIVLNHHSTDRTGEVLGALAERHPHLDLHLCDDPNTSQSYIEHLAGERAWVFGVDGDEIFDPEGLARLRPRLLAGEFDGVWRIDGHMLNPVRICLDEGYAEGFAVPHTPPGTKLYNFGALVSWHEPAKQRLHGRNMVFRPGMDRNSRDRLHEREPWESSDFRALHLCFFPRSSLQSGNPAFRPNPAYVRAGGVRRAVIHLQNFLRNPLARDASYKTRRYRRGPLVRRGIESFGRPSLHAGVDPGWAAAEAVLGREWVRG